MFVTGNLLSFSFHECNLCPVVPTFEQSKWIKEKVMGKKRGSREIETEIET